MLLAACLEQWLRVRRCYGAKSQRNVNFMHCTERRRNPLSSTTAIQSNEYSRLYSKIVSAAAFFKLNTHIHAPKNFEIAIGLKTGVLKVKAFDEWKCQYFISLYCICLSVQRFDAFLLTIWISVLDSLSRNALDRNLSEMTCCSLWTFCGQVWFSCQTASVTWLELTALVWWLDVWEGTLVG